jgi:hypothetical protein
MEPSDKKFVLTQEELTILAFSISAAYPRLYWDNGDAWNGMCFECQRAVVERRLEATE